MRVRSALAIASIFAVLAGTGQAGAQGEAPPEEAPPPEQIPPEEPAAPAEVDAPIGEGDFRGALSDAGDC